MSKYNFFDEENLFAQIDYEVDAVSTNLGFKGYSIGVADAFIGIGTPTEAHLRPKDPFGDGQNIVPATPNRSGDNTKAVWDYFVREHGFTEEAAAGILGNLMQESTPSVDPKMFQKNGPGRGIVQWTVDERWAELVSWAQTRQLDPWNLRTQLDWLVIEMKRYKVYDRLKTYTNVIEAVRYFERTVERAGKPMYEKRNNYALSVYKRFKIRLIGKDLIGR
jgi:hypothetical protein